MTIQVIETGELVEPMSEVEAERITSRIADKLDTIADNLEQVMPLIREALTREAWKALGYTGATAYVSDRFAKALGRLPREVRQPVVMELSAAGMSTRAIAPIVGASHVTVANDMRPSVKNFTDGPRIVESLDGITRTFQPAPAAPTKPRRRPITDQASEVGWDIRRSAEKLQRLFQDDRIGRNKEEVAAHLRGHLMFTIEACQGFLDEINQ